MSPSHVFTIILFLLLIIELARVSEEAPPVAPPVSEPQSLSPSQHRRADESERPAERQPPLELPPEPCKVPLHVPMSNSMSLPMAHISTSLAGGIWVFNFTVNKTFLPVGFTYLENLLISAFSWYCCMQKYLLHHPLSSYPNKSPWWFLWRWTILCPSLQVCWHLLAGPPCHTTRMKMRDWNTLSR